MVATSSPSGSSIRRWVLLIWLTLSIKTDIAGEREWINRQYSQYSTDSSIKNNTDGPVLPDSSDMRPDGALKILKWFSVVSAQQHALSERCCNDGSTCGVPSYLNSFPSPKILALLWKISGDIHLHDGRADGRLHWCAICTV